MSENKDEKKFRSIISNRNKLLSSYDRMVTISNKFNNMGLRLNSFIEAAELGNKFDKGIEDSLLAQSICRSREEIKYLNMFNNIGKQAISFTEVTGLASKFSSNINIFNRLGRNPSIEVVAYPNMFNYMGAEKTLFSEAVGLSSKNILNGLRNINSAQNADINSLIKSISKINEMTDAISKINLGIVQVPKINFNERFLNNFHINLEQINDIDVDTLNEVALLINEENNNSDEPIKEEVDLLDVENAINQLDEIVTYDNNETNRIIYLLKTICEGQQQIILNTSPSIRRTVINNLINFLIGIVMGAMVTLGNKYYKIINQYINRTPVTHIQTIKKEVNQILAMSNNKNEFNKFMYCKKNNVKVKNNNSNKSVDVYKLNVGSVIEIIHKEKKWINIKFIDENLEEEKEGWVLSKYLEKFNS